MSRAKSSGVLEIGMSGPLQDRSEVKCRSSTAAPTATAPRQA